MKQENHALTGFFNNGYKRIDLVLVIADEGSDKIKEMRINYLTNIIKFGLELELDPGKMLGHEHLLFVKVHAPDSIIEEYGLYFNVRKFFKDNHVHHIKPFPLSLDINHERELIKLVRKHYPGPCNYSTLERSKIVYNIINRLPFGQHEQFFGINELRDHNIILDAFALHDGPYFLTPDQKTYINARQTLFYNWVGIGNIWKTQPINMIQEYLGERVAIYFAYYEFFNIMLLFPAIFGFFIALAQTHWKPKLDEYTNRFCDGKDNRYVCPQCRYFDICPVRPLKSYCREFKFIRQIDSFYLYKMAIFVSMWGSVFTVLWKRRQCYLTWLWEVNDKNIENTTNPEYYYSTPQYERSKLTGIMLEKCNSTVKLKRSLQVLLTAALFGIWLFCMFVLSTQIWYIKHWLDKIYNKFYKIRDKSRYNEYLFTAIEAGVYSVLTTALKPITKILSHKLTALENYKTIGSYSFALALKLYGFYFTGSFALLTLHLFVGNIFYTHLLDMNNWYSVSGFKVMNNGITTSLDDMCITLAVAVVIEQIIVKVPLYFMRRTSDYQGVFSKISPSWEREYKLDTLTDEYFHNKYNDIAIQFAITTLFSLTFPLAPFFILCINIWDIRHKARSLLLEYRRPLLLNTSGPAIWHNIILFTSYLAPVVNVCIYVLQSRAFLIDKAYGGEIGHFLKANAHDLFYVTEKKTFGLFKGPGSPAEELKKLTRQMKYCVSPTYNFWIYRRGIFFQEYPSLHVTLYKFKFFIVYSIIGIAINWFIIYMKSPAPSSEIEDVLDRERSIKQRYYIKKGFLLNEK